MNTHFRTMNGGPHLYEKLSLTSVGLVVGLYLVASHVYALLNPEQTMATLKKIHRSRTPGLVILTISMAWFWLLIIPTKWGFLTSLSMDLGEFNKIKPILALVTPLVYFLVASHVREFIFVRSLGLLALLVASPILEAAFLKEPVTRLLLAFFAYALIIKGLFWIGTPYVFRDAVTWLTKSAGRFKGFAIGGVVYGVIVLLCAVIFWRGH